MRKYGRFAYVSGLFLSALLYTNLSSAQSLQSAIDAALSSEPGLAAARSGLEIEEARLAGARAENRSSLGLQGSWGASNADFGNGYKTIYPRTLMLAWEKRIFDGGAALARIDASMFSVAARNGQYLFARNNLVYETAEAYLGLYIALNGRNHANDALNSAQRMARDARLQFDAGEVAIDEKALAEAAVSRAEAALANANGLVKLAHANLFRLTNIQHNEQTLVIDTKPLNIPATETQAKEIAKENHPLLASSKAQLAASEAQLRLAQSSRMPNVSISARANTVRDQFLAGYKTDDIGAYVNFSMPLWDNGRINSELQGERASVGANRASLLAAERNVLMGVTNAYTNYETQKVTQTAAKSSLEAMQIAHKSIEAQMRVGEKPISDLIEAQAKLTAAQVELVKANSNLILARYRILLAIGGEL